MEKLSRTDKYRDYRNKMNNGGEREIATKELKELQDKIIFNEKRFGDSSRTESDLNRGRKDTSSFENANLNRSAKNQEQEKDYLNDIFKELNKYKKNDDAPKNEPIENRDDYINRIKDIVYHTSPQEEMPFQPKPVTLDDKISEFEKLLIKESTPAPQEDKVVSNDQSILDLLPSFSNVETVDDLPSYDETHRDKPVASSENEKPIEEPKQIEETKKVEINSSFENKLFEQLNRHIKHDDIKTQEEYKEEKIAEFADTKPPVEEKPTVDVKPVVETPKSQLENVEIKKASIQPTIPQRDHSRQFEEICMNVNSLAEEIDSANTFAKDQYTPPVSSHKPENSFEGIQQNVKKDLIGSESENKFLNNLEKEVKQYNEDEGISISIPPIEKPEPKKSVVKSEISSEMKEEFDNTVSLQVDKLLGEISSSKADNISATDIMKDNDKAKKNISDQPGKTIAFEVNKKEETSDSTIVLSNPSVEDASIRTMSFKTEDIEVEDTGKSNTILNIILSILIVIAVGALGVIIYFFLITRGII